MQTKYIACAYLSVCLSVSLPPAPPSLDGCGKREKDRKRVTERQRDRESNPSCRGYS